MRSANATTVLCTPTKNYIRQTSNIFPFILLLFCQIKSMKQLFGRVSRIAFQLSREDPNVTISHQVRNKGNCNFSSISNFFCEVCISAFFTAVVNFCFQWDKLNGCLQLSDFRQTERLKTGPLCAPTPLNPSSSSLEL